MSRHCERPGCSKNGEVIYEVDLRRLLVTIDFPDLTDATPVNLLCRRHADSLTVPKGWTIINNREEVQRLFSAPVTQEATKNDSHRGVKRHKFSEGNHDDQDAAVVVNLFDLVIDEYSVETTDRESADFDVDVRAEVVVADVSADITDELAQLMDTQQTHALPWTPQFDRCSDLDGVLRARGRLLGRAFGHSEIDSEIREHEHDHDQVHDQSHSESPIDY